MADDDKELFDSALTDTPEPQAPQDEVSAETPATDEQPRDEHGRFAPKAKDEPEPEQPAVTQEQPQPGQPEPEKPKSDGIPPWRLREEAEARRQAEERARQHEQELAAMRHQLAQMQQQNKQPEQIPDIYENPAGFVGHNVQQAVDPLQARLQQITEYQSQQFAMTRFGEDSVRAAYSAMDSALRSGDPEAALVRQRMQTSLDPYGDMVKWHKRTTVFSKVGDDPDAWFEKQLEERAKDPAFQAKLLERIRGNVQPNAQRPVTQLPPSLNKATSAAALDDSGDDDSDAGLLKSALRR